MSEGTQEHTTPLARPRGRWWKALAIVTAAFLSGGIVGAVVTSQVLWRKSVGAFLQPQFMSERIVEQMEHELLLSDEQSRQIAQILETHRSTLEAIRTETQPRVEAAYTKLKTDIEAVLRPEQAERWNLWYAEMNERWMRPPPGADRRPGFPGDGRRHGPPDGRGMGRGMGPGRQGMPPGPAPGGPGGPGVPMGPPQGPGDGQVYPPGPPPQGMAPRQGTPGASPPGELPEEPRRQPVE